jgi:hypothetical protein
VTDAAPRLASASEQLAILGGIRLALGAGFLAGAATLAARPGPPVAAFALGALGATVALGADRRFARRALVEPGPPPPGAVYGPAWRAALTGMVPSTVGVSVLASASLGFNRTLAGLLAGVLVGMAVATGSAWLRVLARERAERSRLYVERGSRGRVFAARL